MRYVRVACLIAFSIACSSTIRAASAEVIAFKASTKDSFSVAFEGYVGTLWQNGSIPVTFHVVQPGETDIGKIWVDRYTLTYFPAWMNALTCDLNADVCHRKLALPDGSLPDGGLTSTYPLGTEPGIWHGLVPGHLLVLPDLTVIRDTTSVTKVWDPQKSYDDLKRANYACQSELIDGIDCNTLFEYYNPHVGRQKQQPSSYEEPIYTYSLHIDSECVKTCAVMKSAAGLKLGQSEFKDGGSWWLQSPFAFVTTSDPATLDQAARDRGVIRVEKVDNPPSFKLHEGVTPVVAKARDKNLEQRIDAIKNSYETHGWSDTQKLKPLGGWKPDYQTKVLEDNKLPLDEDMMRELQARADTPQPVMIVDLSFDEKHCEFADDGIIIYDCRNPENDFQEMTFCKIREKKTLVASVISDETTGSTTRALQPGCSASDVVDKEDNPETPQFTEKSHGTHLAGIVAAAWDDKFGAGGLHPGARIVGVEIDDMKTDNPQYGQWLSQKLSKIMKRERVHIVNLSLGFDAPVNATTTTGTAPVNDWLTAWIDKKRTSALFVAAAGNHLDPPANCTIMPACKVDIFDNIVSVVALEVSHKAVLSGYNFNKKFTIGSSADKVFGPIPDNKYSWFSGSSQSAAIVSGAVSLATSVGRNYTMSPPVIRNRLIACSTISGADMLDKMLGGGLDFECFINAEKDLVYLDPSVPGAPLVKGEVVDTRHLTFADFDDAGTPTPLNFSRILGFQRMPDDPARVALFWAKSADDASLTAVKLDGTLVGAEVVKVKVGSSIKQIPVSSIVKYVKNTVDGE